MKSSITNLISLVLLIVLSVNQIINWITPEEIPINIEQEIELHDIKQERDLLQKVIDQKEVTIKILEDEFHKIENDSSIDTATVHELENFFTEYRRNRHQ